MLHSSVHIREKLHWLHVREPNLTGEQKASFWSSRPHQPETPLVVAWRRSWGRNLAAVH